MDIKKLRVLAVSLVLVLAAVGTVGYSFINSDKPEETSTPTETLTTQYVGFESLLDYGITTVQLTLIQQATSDFVDKTNRDAKTVAVGTSGVKQLPRPEDSTINTLEYPFSVDGKVYTAKVNYIGLRAAQLLVIDSSGQQIFDSGVKQSN